MSSKYYIAFLLLFLCQNIFAQDHIQKEDQHDHHKNEIGIANMLVYFVNEMETGYGFHMHYVRNISESQFGIGLGYERIFDEHKHNTIGIVGTYRPIDPLAFSISPGITFEGREVSETNFALHLEASYEFELGDFHIGPLVEFAYDPEDIHISLGLHIGYGF